MPTWGEFAWAAFLFRAIGEDRDYQCLMSQTEFLHELRTNPMVLEPVQIQEQLIRGFLNRWRCRLVNTEQSACAIKKTICHLLSYLQELDGLVIENVSFDQIVNVNNTQITIDQAIEQCYTSFRDLEFRFGSTAASKILHVLQPGLFVMWDRRILAHYREQSPEVSDSGGGYCTYLKMMQCIAMEVREGFREAGLDPPAQTDESPDSYLSTRMGYDPPKTLAKYIDEYNWITITNRVQVPPPWHP